MFDGIELVVDARGRFACAAIFGRFELLFLDEPWLVPEARFLCDVSTKCRWTGSQKEAKAHLFLMTSVFNDSGLTTPWSFCMERQSRNLREDHEVLT